MLFVQLRTPVRISSGIYSNRDLDAMSELGMRDVLSNACFGNLSAYNTVANGKKYSDCQASPKYKTTDMPPTPPTYDEAIRIGTRRGLDKEKGLTTGRW